MNSHSPERCLNNANEAKPEDKSALETTDRFADQCADKFADKFADKCADNFADRILFHDKKCGQIACRFDVLGTKGLCARAHFCCARPDPSNRSSSSGIGNGYGSSNNNNGSRNTRISRHSALDWAGKSSLVGKTGR